MGRKEACEISPAAISFISRKYEVLPRVLEARVGWWFVGEIGCEWWFGILSPYTFEQTYELTQEIGEIGFIVKKKEVGNGQVLRVGSPDELVIGG